MKAFSIKDFIASSTAKSGTPLKVTSKKALRRAASLLSR